ncbi:MAG: hypothetical protein WC731_02120 [Candidatus Omnitrophota bacterium]|jgi:hypothetical protein
MDKIKKLIKDMRDAYILVGDGRIYMTKLGDRKEVTQDTQVLSFRDLFLTVDLLIDKVTELEDKLTKLENGVK